MRRTGAAFLAGVLCTALLGGCSSGDDDGDGSAISSTTGGAAAGRTGDTAPRLAAGDLLTATPLGKGSTAALPSAGSHLLVTYVSSDLENDDVVVSGTIAIPKGDAPEGGWPVLSWAHGTVGLADVCAPSNDTADGLAHDYLGPVSEVLDRWVADGFVVAQTDYQGLGTPGDHPYLSGVIEANNVVDIVRAARQLEPAVGRDWFAAGHSQGGQATVFTAARGAKRAPDLRLLGAVAVAPPSGLSQVVEVIKTGNQALALALPFLPQAVLGAAAVDPSVDADAIFTDASRPLLTAARTGCIATIRAAATGMSVASAIDPAADVTAVNRVLATEEATGLELSVPTMVAQGDADVLVSKGATDALVAALCANGASIDYRIYPGADHRQSVPDSFEDARAFARARLNGERAPSGC